MSLKIKSLILSKIILFVLIFLTTVWAAGEIDTAFNVAAYQIPGYSANPPMMAQPDGKLLIAFFEFGVNNGIAGEAITRFNADGTIDASFHAPRLSSGTVSSFGLQSNGKILIRGNFTIANSPYSRLARLNTDGSLDTTFNANMPALPHDGYRLFVQPDDSFFTGTVYKFDANGFLDNTFQYQPYFGNATAIAGLPDGKVYVSAEVPMSSGFDFLVRHNADGTRDNSFSGVQPNTNIKKMIVLPDGKLLIAGPFSFVNSTPAKGIARINQDGSIDSTFNPGGAGANSNIFDMDVQPDGKILITGSFDTYNSVIRRRVARLNADGTLDTSFNYTGTFNNVFPGDLEILAGGKIVVGGSLLSTTQLPASFIMLNSDGSQVPDFFVQKAIPQRVRKTAVQSDGKIFVAGEFRIINGYRRNSLARLNQDGTVDPSFIPFFYDYSARGDQIIHQVLVQPDGKILVSFNHSYVMVRLNQNGSNDPSFINPFSNSVIIYDFALQSDGKILVVGENPFVSNTFVFARLNSNGSLDSSFNPPIPNKRIYRVLLQPDGKSLICGEFTQISTSNRGRIARYNTDGTLDQSFNPAGGADGNVYDIDLQADGKIVVGGTFGTLNGSERIRVGKLNPDGGLDTSFVQYVDGIVQTVKAQPDGKVLIGGLFANVGGTPREKLARLNSDGSPDLTFNASADALVFDINLQTDGKILVAGDFAKVNNVTKLAIARLNNSAPRGKLFDYDGDGRADISVFRPSENKWYILQSSTLTVTEKIFAVAGDIPAPADFDGDGKTDAAVFRPSSGDWWYLSSINNAQIFAHWGQTGDIPRPSDFDGDGKTDYVVYRPSNSVWYRLGTTGATSILAFGLAGDKPLVGDFDGDGKSDPAIFRPSSGDWWYAASASGGQFLAVRWGQNGDIPAPADFDGDGKTDFAIYRPSNGVWYILRTSDLSYTIMQFGLAEDKPVPADYDGDGRADIAVFRPSTAIWYLLQSTSGFGALQFGSAGDIPTENAFIP